MDITRATSLAWSLMLEAIAPPPEADEFMAELCHEGVTSEAGVVVPYPEAVVDGT